jgi:hypothetical protein
MHDPTTIFIVFCVLVVFGIVIVASLSIVGHWAKVKNYREANRNAEARQQSEAENKEAIRKAEASKAAREYEIEMLRLMLAQNIIIARPSHLIEQQINHLGAAIATLENRPTEVYVNLPQSDQSSTKRIYSGNQELRRLAA